MGLSDWLEKFYTSIFLIYYYLGLFDWSEKYVMGETMMLSVYKSGGENTPKTKLISWVLMQQQRGNPICGWKNLLLKWPLEKKRNFDLLKDLSNKLQSGVHQNSVGIGQKQQNWNHIILFWYHFGQQWKVGLKLQIDINIYWNVRYW